MIGTPTPAPIAGTRTSTNTASNAAGLQTSIESATYTTDALPVVAVAAPTGRPTAADTVESGDGRPPPPGPAELRRRLQRRGRPADPRSAAPIRVRSAAPIRVRSAAYQRRFRRRDRTPTRPSPG